MRGKIPSCATYRDLKTKYVDGNECLLESNLNLGWYSAVFQDCRHFQNWTTVEPL